MLLLVFDDYKLHMRRLGVVNALTSSITRAQQHGPIMATALEELKGLMRAKAAWFRLLEGDRMVIAQQIGLSKDFLQDRLSVPLDDDFERTLGGTVPVVVVTSAAAETVRPYLKQEGFHHVVMVPVLGKKSVIGTLALGSRSPPALLSRRNGISRHHAPTSWAWRSKTCAWWNRFCAPIGSGPTPSIPSMTWSCFTTPISV